MQSISLRDGILALLCASLLGLNVVFSKMGVGYFPPFLFTSLRFLICAPLVIFFPLRGVSIKHLVGISMCMGFLYLGCMNVALYAGTSAGVTILFAQLSVFVMIMLSSIFLKDKPKRHQILGMCLGFFGIILIAWTKGFAASVTGFLALFVSTFAYAFGTIAIKKHRFDPMALNVWIAFVSAAPMLMISFLFEDNIVEIVRSATLAHWGLVFFAGFGSMLIAGAGFTYLVNKYSLTAVTPFRLSTPVFGILFAVLLLSESYPLIVWIGAALTLLGVTIAQIGHRYKRVSVTATCER